MITRFRRLSWPKRLLVLGGSGFGLVLVLIVLGYLFTSVPTPNKIATDQSTTIAYYSGSPIGVLGKNRQIVGLDQISPAAQHAVLAAEDRDFYSEPGISLKGIGRALFTNVQAGGVQQGGSTITQQYAKNAFLTKDRTFTRKIKEVFIAVKMSQTVPKSRILADYLNTIYFGRGAYGIQTAAQTYFGVSAKDLTPAQAAVLASSIRSPAGYDPQRHPDKAKARWNFVLDGMVKKGWLSTDDRSKLTYPTVHDRGQSKTDFPGPLDHVRDQVLAELDAMGYSEDRVQAGGLWIKTTLDSGAEKAAIAAMTEKRVPAEAIGALVSIEPGTGRVKAYYGGGTAGGLDLGSDVAALPGSSMKPYVLATALEEGKSLSSQYPGQTGQQICGQTVHNDQGDPSFGNIDLTTGLQYSVNTVYFRLACDVGPKKIVALMRKAGLDNAKDKLDGEGSLSAQIALGSGGYEVRPIDQAEGYATFAANGIHAKTHFVEQVCDLSHKNCTSAGIRRDQAMPSDVAANTTAAMAKVVEAGTGTNAQLPGRNVAGKTGTTTNNTNAWFCGFTPNQLATVVWLAKKGGGTLSSGGSGVYGGTLPAELWHDYMQTALQGKPVTPFPKAASIGTPSTPSGAPTASATTTPTATSSALPTATATKPPVVPTSPPPVVPTQPPPTSAPPEPTSSPTPPSASDAASPRSSP